MFIRFKALVRQCIPPIVLNVAENLFHKANSFETGFKDWDAAEQACEGYDSAEIIAKVERSAKLVFDGRAVYERDSCLFDEIHYSWPLLASLLFAAANGRTLNVVDFGGALGTSFQQNRRFLTRLPGKCEWRIVEQSKFVDIGKRDFSNEYLSFYRTIADAAKSDVDVILFGSSICYVKNPYQFIDEALATNAGYIIFDRTPIARGEEDTFAVQHIPPSIYKASYPIRNFSYSNITAPFHDKFELIEEWVCDLQADPHTTAMGFLFKRKQV